MRIVLNNIKKHKMDDIKELGIVIFFFVVFFGWIELLPHLEKISGISLDSLPIFLGFFIKFFGGIFIVCCIYMYLSKKFK